MYPAVVGSTCASSVDRFWPMKRARVRAQRGPSVDVSSLRGLQRDSGGGRGNPGTLVVAGAKVPGLPRSLKAPSQRRVWWVHRRAFSG